VASVFANGYLAPLVVEVRGDSLEGLAASQAAVMEVARTVPGLRDVFPGLESDYPELKVSVDREVAGLMGISARDVAQVTLESTLGNINTPGVWVDASNGQSYFVVTGYDGAQVTDAAELASMPVRASATQGSQLLGSYAHVDRGVGTIAVERDMMSRVATIRFQVERRDLGSVANELEARLKADPRTRGLDWGFVGQVDLMRRTFGGLGLALGLAVMVVFMVMTSQFRSLRLPLVILFTVPMTSIGIVLALLLSGQPLSISAVMGVLMVVGIAVSNGILLVDHANRRFLEGLDATAAALDAARARVVPILMTSLATVIGLLPTALGLDPEAATNRPLALAVVGGLTSSTVLSLFVVPCVFTLLARRPKEEETLHPVPLPA
jgi:multidrug efflux pump subunit AcrB